MSSPSDHAFIQIERVFCRLWFVKNVLCLVLAIAVHASSLWGAHELEQCMLLNSETVEREMIRESFTETLNHQNGLWATECIVLRWSCQLHYNAVVVYSTECGILDNYESVLHITSLVLHTVFVIIMAQPTNCTRAHLYPSCCLVSCASRF